MKYILRSMFKKTTKKHVLVLSVILILGIWLYTAHLTLLLQGKYRGQESATIIDRNGMVIKAQPNSRGHYAIHSKNYPTELKEFVIRKEDRFFFYHPGINPISIARALLHKATKNTAGGSSTITQQLAKILLENEASRTIKNKLIELMYTFALELHLSKEEILNMYMSSVYLGNQAQGFAEASLVYFDKQTSELTESEIISLLATISSPSVQNPWKEKNELEAAKIAKRFKVYPENPARSSKIHAYNSATSFELTSLQIPNCKNSCQTTLDTIITERLRTMLGEIINDISDRGATHGAIVVISVPENEIIALVGSPFPYKAYDEYQINMALKPRPIGSTIKPFIYAKGFEMGLRPYTKVLDREYKYPVISGFPIYPKNFDGQYQGEVSLHKALSNSLNVPTVKVLEYVGLNNFYEFLLDRLDFEPIVDIDTYAFGIALGGLEMDLLTLSHYFTIFPNEGEFKPISIIKDNESNTNTKITPQSSINKTQKVFDKTQTQLITKILSDRNSGVEQFGMKSNLNLPYTNYAVKTGTSRDFHDSWTIGYTPDFVVGVWIGNAVNKPLQNISGLGGAGRVWKHAMDILLNSSYNKNTDFSFDEITEYNEEGTLVYGLKNDNYKRAKNLLKDTALILSPHDGDRILFTPDTIIPFSSTKQVKWAVNGHTIGISQQLAWKPDAPGTYTITAHANQSSERIVVTITKDENKRH